MQTPLQSGADPDDPDENDKRFEFKYDYLGRRVEKRVLVYTSGNWVVQTGGWQRFVYDGWNVVLVLDGSSSNAITRKYAWGLDLSGSVHGAGGIGGLLAAVETGGALAGTYWYLYDGNGNVGAIVDATNPAQIHLDAAYRYDPYGNAFSATGAYAAANPFRFSTKWLDSETALYYYGYRYYSPAFGRWISRDPIGEEGGVTLYAFVSNRPTNMVDVVGLWGTSAHKALTEYAFGVAIAGMPMVSISMKCRSCMLTTLKEANGYQDRGLLGGDGGFNDMRRHYNRDPQTPGTTADDDYAAYLKLEEQAFSQSLLNEPPTCHAALEAEGRLSHSHQDFFAHAIRRDGKGDREYSDALGFEAWTAYPPVIGTPDSRDSFWPSSYPGEHPKLHEPLVINGDEFKARYAAAQAYSMKRFRSSLERWLERCRCECNSKK